MAINKDNADAMTGYAYMLKQGDGVPKNSSEVITKANFLNYI